MVTCERMMIAASDGQLVELRRERHFRPARPETTLICDTSRCFLGDVPIPFKIYRRELVKALRKVRKKAARRIGLLTQ
jgi:F420-0:gamma-glutamyl ligase-like protein